LIIISVDLIAIVIGFLEKNSSQTENIYMNIQTLLKYAAGANKKELMLHTNFTWSPEVAEVANRATNDVFVSNITAIPIISSRYYLENVNKDITVRLLSMNVDDAEMFKHFCKMRYTNFEKHVSRYTNMSKSNNDILSEILERKKNIEKRMSNRIIPCSFFAVDIIKPNKNSVLR
jgi:adenine-specific DNA methylase